MEFKPFNRYILVKKEIIENLPINEQRAQILVPDVYIPESPHGLYKVVKIAPDCEKIDLEAVDKIIVVNTSMVENIEVGNEKFSLILENYVYGVFENNGEKEHVN